jgi:predicted amidohydrolase YtcJ
MRRAATWSVQVRTLLGAAALSSAWAAGPCMAARADASGAAADASGRSASAAADLVLRHGVIYTEDSGQPWVEALAVRGGRLSFVGSDRGSAKYIGRDTQVIDLDGHMVMPGLIDAHVHPVEGARDLIFSCRFAATLTPLEIQSALKKCIAARPGAVWVYGGHWASGLFDRYPQILPRTFLDAVSGDTSVVLEDDSEHNAWLNSKALALAGFNAATPDPPSGRVVRENGSRVPNGILLEHAAMDAFSRLPAPSAADQQRAVREAARIAHAFGFTGLKDAYTFAAEARAYQAVDRAGDLNLWVATCLASSETPNETYGSGAPIDVARLARLSDEVKSTHVLTRFAKIILDGVPTPARTAAMLHPYLPDANGVVGSGMLHVDAELLKRDLIALDRAGFTVKMHAAGDRSVREGLDAIAAARRANGRSGLRHELAHAGFVSPEDLPRFKELDAVAEFSPTIWFPSPIIDSIVSAVGPAGRHYWPVRTLLDLGAPVAAGSDWPAVVPSMDPWSGIEAFVTRADPAHVTPGTLWPEQAITLAEAIHLYTLDGARALRLETRTGSLTLGKSADFIIIDRNLFKIPPTQIAASVVLATYFEGRRVYAHE